MLLVSYYLLRPDNNGIVQPDGRSSLLKARWLMGRTTCITGNGRFSAVSERAARQERQSDRAVNVVFSPKESAGNGSGVYQIEALDIDEDGIVTIKADNYAVMKTASAS